VTATIPGWRNVAAREAEAFQCADDEFGQCRAADPDARDGVFTAETEPSRCGAAHAPHQTGAGDWICDDSLREDP
jgi:hypothetical protein